MPDAVPETIWTRSPHGSRGPQRELLLALTYAVVVFSILGQGLTIRSMITRVLKPAG